MINELHPHEIDHVQDLDPNPIGDPTPLWFGFISPLPLFVPLRATVGGRNPLARTGLTASEVNIGIASDCAFGCAPSLLQLISSVNGFHAGPRPLGRFVISNPSDLKSSTGFCGLVKRY
jgi:hypothetical protein